MTKSTITRERMEEIMDCCWMDDLGLSMDELSELARMALAAMDSEPVAEVYQTPNVGICAALGPSIRMLCALEPGTKLYLHAQPAPVSYSDFEEFWSAYIHPLAQDDELKDFSWGIWNACVSNSQPAPVVPDGYVMVPKEMTDEIGEAIAMQANCCGGIALDIYDAMLAAAPQSPGGDHATVPGKWIPVSERMPEDEQEVLTINKMGHRFVSFFDKHSGLFFDRLDAPAACCIERVLVTYWMPLPAAPQEVKSES